jgi:hypothetical protein
MLRKTPSIKPPTKQHRSALVAFEAIFCPSIQGGTAHQRHLKVANSEPEVVDVDLDTVKE